MTSRIAALRRAAVALFVALACVALPACGDDDDDGVPPAATESPVAFTQAPRPPFQTPTASGINAPVQTPQSTPVNLTRDRAEAFLRRVAITEADVPPALREEQSGLVDNDAAAQTELDPAAGRTRYDRQGRILGFGRTFAVPPGGALPSGSAPAVLQVRHAAALYSAPAGAADALAHLSTVESTDPAALKRIILPQALEGLLADPTLTALPRPTIGEQARAWEMTGPLRTAPGRTGTVTVVAVQRGPSLSYITAYGTGDEPRRLALELAGRLDTRVAEALRTGP